MDQPEQGKKQGKPRILVAPLDWGLGHATRCIPVIRELINQGCEPILAGEGAQENLLKHEFPDLTYLPLRGYKIRYAKTVAGLVRNMVFQVPRILRTIKAENQWLKNIITQYSINAVISDNRYGLYSPLIPCVFITHQLRIKSPWSGLTESILQNINYRFIQRFNSCWIPDIENGLGLAGDLSHPTKKPGIPINYIGILSRFNPVPVNEVKNHLLILLSGPEPQRSILENLLVSEIAHYQGTATIVRGLPGAAGLIPSTNMIKFYNHLPANALSQEIQEAEFVIGRCGYSSVMDLMKLKKRSILIPTPGQTEQEYLATFLTSRRYVLSIKQKRFSIAEAIKKAAEFEYSFPLVDNFNKLKEVISALIHVAAEAQRNTANRGGAEAQRNTG